MPSAFFRCWPHEHANFLAEPHVGLQTDLQVKHVDLNEIATETPISGTLDNPQTSTWTTIANLLQNAFFSPSCPGLSGRQSRRDEDGERSQTAST